MLSTGVEHSTASTGRAYPSPFVRCSASTSGRPFGSVPCVDRGHCRRWSSGESLLQPLPTSLRSTQRSPRVEAVRGSKQDRSKKSNEQAPTKPGEHSGGFMGGIVNDLLYGAASRMERGQTTCIKCKGTGSCVCPNCKGQGVVQPDKLKRAADPVRQAANMVSSMLGGSNSSEYNSHMLRSNRCQTCHGAGQCTCPTCQGHGFRGDDYD